MAYLVEVLCVPHDPTLPGLARRGPEAPPPIRRALGIFDDLRARLDAAAPDVLLVVAGDHLSQWFLDNMPAFLIGKAARAKGPFVHEQELFGVEPYDTEIAGSLARHLLRQGLNTGIDFAYSDDFTIDHGFTVPLSFLRPRQDLPVVPLFTNVMAPPVATGRRFHQIGGIVRELVAGYAEDVRVAVISSGHMSNAIGGPDMARFLTEPETPWDTRTWQLLTSGDVGTLIEECTYERLITVGQGTPGFLDYLFALGVAGGRAPDWAELMASPFAPAMGFLRWDEAGR